jgi:hypothetical protein
MRIYKESKTIKLAYYIKIPIDSVPTTSTPIRIILQQHSKPSLLFNSIVTKRCECVFELDKSFVDSYRNKLIEMMGRFCPYKSGNLVKNVKSFFFSPDLPAGSLRAFCSFLSTNEVPTINSTTPASLFTLSKWLLVRKFAYHLMFAGYVNIRGSTEGVNNVFWTRRYVKWYGYTVFVLNEDSKEMIGSIN